MTYGVSSYVTDDVTCYTTMIIYCSHKGAVRQYGRLS